MSSDCYTCYKIEGDTRGLRRLVGIVARILRWRGSYLDYCKNRWRQDDLYDVNDDVEKIKEICRTILENDCVKAIEALPDGKSLWTFWAQTSRIPRPEMWQELAARYVPGARVYYFAENVYDAFALTNDRDKRWFRKDYLLYLDCSSEKRPEPELLTRLRQVLERPAYYREWPYDEYRCYISYWTVYEVQQLFRRLLGLPQTAPCRSQAIAAGARPADRRQRDLPFPLSANQAPAARAGALRPLPAGD